jgi:hypothetical protein
MDRGPDGPTARTGWQLKDFFVSGEYKARNSPLAKGPKFELNVP